MSQYPSEWDEQIKKAMEQLSAGANALLALIFVVAIVYGIYWVAKDRKKD